MRYFLLPSISFSQLAALAALLTFSPATRAQKITTFDPPNSTMTIGVAINVHGQVAGYYNDGSAVFPFQPQKGFLRERNGSFTTFQPETTLNGQTFGLFTWVTDLNREGEVTGYFADLGAITSSGFLRQRDGTMIKFKGGSTLPAAETLATESLATESLASIPCDKDNPCVDGTGAFAINARGEIVGGQGNGSRLGFLREPDGTTINFTGTSDNLLTVPQAINFFGQVTGFAQAAGPLGRQGFLRQPNGTIIPINVPNSTNTWPQSINLFSQIAGYFSDANGIVHGFLRQPNGKFVTFDPPGSTDTEGVSINLHGEITGFYVTADGKSHGFVRSAMGDIDTFDAPGAGSAGTFPKGINDRGEIVGYYEDGNFVIHGFVRSKN